MSKSVIKTRIANALDIATLSYPHLFPPFASSLPSVPFIPLILQFATKDFKEGELIERGVMRRLPMGFDGHKCEEVFTWSDERPNKTWAMGSGCAPYYNTTSKEKENTHMVRYFDENRFEIFAKRDIKAGDEVRRKKPTA